MFGFPWPVDQPVEERVSAHHPGGMMPGIGRLGRPLSLGLGLGIAVSLWIGGLGLMDQPAAHAQFVLRGNVRYYRSFQQANRQIEAGKWADAEKTYMQYLRRYPNNVQARAALAVVQAELLKLGAAEKNAKDALRRNPKNSYAHIAMGTVYRNLTLSSNMTYRNQRDQLLDQARESFEKAVTLDPKNPDAHNRLGEIYRIQGNWPQAEEHFRKAASADPKFSEAWANIGTTYLAKGDVNEAKVYYKKAIKQNSKNDTAHYYLGQAYAQEGNYHDAYESLNTALYLNPDSPRSAMVYTRMGEVLERQGNTAGAIAKYREAISKRPEYVEAYHRLADLMEFQGDGELAMAEMKSALNANPGYTPFMNRLGNLALSVDKPDQAIRYYNAAVQADPNNSVALEGLSQAYEMSAHKQASLGSVGGADSYVEAEMAIDKAIQANPSDPKLHLARLRIAKLSGKPDLSRQELQTISTLPVRHTGDAMAKAEALFALGQFQNSDTLYRQVIQQEQGNERTMLALGESLRTQGNLPMAREVYQTLLTQEPNNLKAQRGIQRIDTQVRQSEKQQNLAASLNSVFSKTKARSARDFYMEAVILNPRNPEWRKDLAKLHERFDDYEKAIWEYEAYLDLSPELTDSERSSIQRKIRRLEEKLASQQRPNS